MMIKKILETIQEDIRTAAQKDPAAGSKLEIFLCYPGLHALWSHRIAHKFWQKGWRLSARIISHISRFLTGIEIHPAASIGRRLFIDHGSGVVIGETASIGNDVLIYQGVVLGGVSLARGKRHPDIGDGVMIGAGAIILGPVVIGANARIGAASLVVQDVPQNSLAVGVPAKLGVGFSGHEIWKIAEAKLPDPTSDKINALEKRLASLEAKYLSNKQ